MKLNKIQMDALASKITTELNDENNSEIIKYNNDIQESDEYINFESKNEDCISIMNIRKKYKSIDSYHFERICGDIKRAYFKKKFKQEVPLIYSSNVYNSIVLNTIECEDIEEIISKIKTEFKKKK